ncbi:MAG: type II toxin-antitoxin system VapC family toxin [Syntrophales bacterium]|jgi:predicted nucleic acid-binding protein|nr:type II toxin-antitoxin system VapC family toxin [Syntrophales bacterium]
MKRAVVDASVILKWYLVDEACGAQAISLLQQCVAGELEILAPSLLQYELMNGLVIAGRRARLDQSAISSSFRSFMSLGIRFYDVYSLADKVLHYCRLYGRSVYDSSYLALAEQEGVDLSTADERLFNAVQKDLPWVHLI